MIRRAYSQVNLVGAGKYLIRLIDNKNIYMHYESDSEDEITLNMREGIKGAVAFTEEQANKILESYKNIEKVPVKDVLPNDGSLN